VTDIRKATHDKFADELHALIRQYGPNREPFSPAWDGIIDALAEAIGVTAYKRGGEYMDKKERMQKIMGIIRKAEGN